MENNLNINQQDYHNQNFQRQEDIPNSVGVLVMGIVSIATCWCYGIPGAVLGIITLILSKNANELYNANPNQYTLKSFNNLKAGKITAIIGLAISGLWVLYIIVVFLFYGFAALSEMPWQNF